MRTACLLSGCVLGLVAYAGPAAAQTVVEYGAGAGAAAVAAGPAKGAGASIGGAFESLSKTLKQGQAPAAAPAASARPASTGPAKPKTEVIKEVAAAAPAAPPPSYEDAMGIQKGMNCEDMVRRFGPPAMAFATEDDAKTMSYASKAGGVQVECQGGKVASVDKPR